MKNIFRELSVYMLSHQQMYSDFAIKTINVLNKHLYENMALCYGDALKKVKEFEETYNNGWVPVNMVLPEEPDGNFNDVEEIENAILQGKLTEYIVTIANATESTALYYAGDGYWWDDESKDFYNVAAWQPLPEPYKAM